MASTLRSLALVAVLAIGCAGTAPSPIVAPEAPFPAPFAFAGEWRPVSIGRLPRSPERFGSLDILLESLQPYLEAGIRRPRAGAGVTIAVPEGAARAEEVHLFVTIIGGATDATIGRQMRLVVLRDARGWRLDPDGLVRVYCERPLTGVTGDLCR